jgi:hypothetical protein
VGGGQEELRVTALHRQRSSGSSCVEPAHEWECVAFVMWTKHLLIAQQRSHYIKRPSSGRTESSSFRMERPRCDSVNNSAKYKTL